MQCGIESINDCERSPNRTGLRVNFSEKGEAVKERREKFLTAKYGSHQMSLIRKRLAVEMWLYDELQKLFDPPSEAVDVDIDEILDMDTDDIRRSHLIELLSVCKRSPQDISVSNFCIFQKPKQLTCRIKTLFSINA
ncbi:Protein phosphatase 1 regulatory subunit 14B [Pseudolycoriella hygida]|uniref:Protein phosphatase 1 regulatory subunit 14B n=1 Tax=Pseudolycoriella hygida TaxID=35572 RepID=A0A9Q0S8T3_9DIPT|nr:Protein phosphatase 1 regulatory subunit 14B [Pseudolycoriella hygida]